MSRFTSLTSVLFLSQAAPRFAFVPPIPSNSNLNKITPNHKNGINYGIKNIPHTSVTNSMRDTSVLFIKNDSLSDDTDKAHKEREILNSESNRPDNVFFVSDAFKNAVDSNNSPQDEYLSKIEIKTQIKGKPANDPKITQETHSPRLIPDHDPDIYKSTERITNTVNILKSTVPKPVLSIIVDSIKKNIADQVPTGSYLGQTISALLDMLILDDDPEGHKEFLYLLLKIADILDKTALTNDSTNKTPTSIFQSIALDAIEKLLGFIQMPNLLDMASFINPFSLFTSKEQPKVIEGQSKINELIDHLKSELVSTLRTEEVNSLATKIKLVIYLGLTIDTARDVNSEEIVEYFHKLGIIFSKVAQTIGGQANNPFFKDGGTKERIIEACKALQRNSVPMTKDQALAQMSTYYAPQFGPDWKNKMFKEIDFSKPMRVGTIACIYQGVATDGRKVIVKVKKPIEKQLAMEKVQVGQVLRAIYDIIQEGVNSFERLDRPVPGLLDKANLFQRSETSTKNFLERFEAELRLEQEAKAMQQTRVLTPEIESYTPNAIIMDYIEDGLTPFEYIEIADRCQPTDYTTAESPIKAAEEWFKTHYPYEIREIKTASKSVGNGCKTARNESNNLHQMSVKFKGDIDDFPLSVKGRPRNWHIEPKRPYIDFSARSRELIAAQNLVDLFIQLLDGKFNADNHAGNFLIAPSNEPGKNLVYNIDFGFTVSIDNKESKLAWNFIKGITLKNTRDIAKSYLDMTERGRTATLEEYNEMVEKFSRVLIETEYTKMLIEEPDQAMGPVMEWLAEENYNIDSKFYAIIRAFAGTASNAATMQNGRPITAQQLASLTKQLLANKLLH